MTYYQPQLKLGWWIFKGWTTIYASTLTGYINETYNGICPDYDEAMGHFEEYKKLTNTNYRMVHPRSTDVPEKKKPIQNNDGPEFIEGN